MFATFGGLNCDEGEKAAFELAVVGKQARSAGPTSGIGKRAPNTGKQRLILPPSSQRARIHIESTLIRGIDDDNHHKLHDSSTILSPSATSAASASTAPPRRARPPNPAAVLLIRALLSLATLPPPLVFAGSLCAASPSAHGSKPTSTNVLTGSVSTRATVVPTSPRATRGTGSDLSADSTVGWGVGECDLLHEQLKFHAGSTNPPPCLTHVSLILTSSSLLPLLKHLQPEEKTVAPLSLLWHERHERMDKRRGVETDAKDEQELDAHRSLPYLRPRRLRRHRWHALPNGGPRCLALAFVPHLSVGGVVGVVVAHGSSSSWHRGSSSLQGGHASRKDKEKEKQQGDRPVLLLLGIRLGLDGVAPIFVCRDEAERVDLWRRIKELPLTIFDRVEVDVGVDDGDVSTTSHAASSVSHASASTFSTRTMGEDSVAPVTPLPNAGFAPARVDKGHGHGQGQGVCCPGGVRGARGGRKAKTKGKATRVPVPSVHCPFPVSAEEDGAGGAWSTPPRERE
ncbi:hypothetical protein MSAN_02402500 [Mycena sanguinolenta]|uniref:Uncharacterized protein n=1 Tax=Mycena sanguinolenta TaxID=230812 RepID=A0A8H7CFT8_9AGAR|nr:hypothetical protein MSAN_02402500 [Mycena sanguinolenta]